MSSTLCFERCPRLALSLIGALAALVVSGCGGGGSDDAAVGPPPSSAAGAATATANSGTNDCNDARPFYWEVGNADGTTASGTVNSSTDSTVYTATTRLAIASASKWFYSSYFVQRTGGALSAADIKFFNFQSGYAARDFPACRARRRRCRNASTWATTAPTTRPTTACSRTAARTWKSMRR